MSVVELDGHAEALAAAAKALSEGRDDDAATALASLVERLDLSEHPSDLTFHVFASALGKRLERRVPGVNLYLRRFDLTQISLFNLLATHLPLVAHAGRLANEVLAAFVADEENVVLLDVGIGTAQQEVALLKQLARRKRLRRLHVIAIEPSITSLVEANAALAQAGSRTGIDVELTAVEALVEDLDADAWKSVGRLIDGQPVVVNAAFAAHHILGATAGGPVAAREEFLRRVSELDPLGVVLAEPNSDHYEPDFGRRFTHCWNHFSTVFRLVDGLEIDEDDRSAIKIFFAREIEDILANDEAVRAERHEPTERWLARLQAVGLVPATGFDGVAGPAPGGVEIVAARGYAGITFESELLVSVLAAAPKEVDLRLRPAAGAPVYYARWTPTGTERMRVRDVMTPAVTISLHASLAEVAELLWSTGASDLAVLGDDGLFVGVLSEGDVIRRLLPATNQTASAQGSRVEAFDLLFLNGWHAAPQPIEPMVIRDPVVLAPTDDLVLAATEMVRRQIRRLPVVTYSRELVGSVSRADLCRALLGSH